MHLLTYVYKYKNVKLLVEMEDEMAKFYNLAVKYVYAMALVSVVSGALCP